MQVEALTCPRCGAPLPPPRYGAASCGYCGVPLATGAHGTPPVAPAWTRAAETRRSMLVAFEQALAHATQGSRGPVDGVVELDVDRVRVLAARAPDPPKRGFFAKLFG